MIKNLKKLLYIVIILTLCNKTFCRPHGLRNFGSNCYINSFVQAFSALDPVTAYLLTLDLNKTYKPAIAGPPAEANIAYYYPIFLKQLKLLPVTPKDTKYAADTLDYLGFVNGFKPTVLETPIPEVTDETAYMHIQEFPDGTSTVTPFPFTKEDINYIQRLNTFYIKGLAPFLYRAVFRTITLPENVEDLKTSLASCRQEDVPEFTERLINALLDQDIRYRFIDTQQALQKHPLGNLFRIEIAQTHKCADKTYVNKSQESRLSLETTYDEGKQTLTKLQDCIDTTLSPHPTKFTPPGFTVEQVCIEQSKLMQLSDIVIVALKRFGYDKTAQKGIKLKHKIAIPLEYNFAPHLPDNYKDQTKYELIAAIEHSGDFGSGHYIAYVKQEKQWYICNDEHVFAANATDIADYSNKWGATGNVHRGIDYAYVYFYQSKTPIQRKIPSEPEKPSFEQNEIKLLEKLQALTNQLKNLEQFLKK